MDCEILQATIDEEAFPISVVAAAKELSRCSSDSSHEASCTCLAGQAGDGIHMSALQPLHSYSRMSSWSLAGVSASSTRLQLLWA